MKKSIFAFILYDMKKCVLVLLLLSSLFLAACGKPAERPADETAHSRTVFAMDTVMNLTVYGGDGEAALDAAEAELYRLDALLSRGTEGSAVYALNHEGTVVDAAVAELIGVCAEISQATNGAFDPTIAPLLELWGFGSGAGEHRVPTQAEIDAALASVGEKNIHRDGEQVVLDLPAQIDFGGVAKGLSGERLRDVWAAYHVTGAAADLGGDVTLLGSKPNGTPWRVAVKDPANTGAYLGILDTTGNVYVATSGVYERYFEQDGARYHHILDPKTGRPADSGVVSATVVCESGVWADALATACCVLGVDGSLALRGRTPVDFDLILVTDDGRALYTCEGFTPTAGNVYTYQSVR